MSYEIGSNNFSFSANYIEDLISPAYTLTDENVRIYQAQNFGAVKKYRLDYNFTGNLKKWIYVNFSLGAQYYDFQTNDNLLEGKRFSINNSIYTGIKLSETTSLNFFNIYFSEFQQHVVRDKGYYKLDTSIEKKLWKGKGLIKISIHDVFDSFRARNISTYSDFSFQFFQKRRTQGLSLFLQYKFDNNKKVNKKSVRSSQTRYRL
ncbi:hypothetical protein JCM19274_5015 [Algibacter lectus]|uniref:Outer membrane protein beta-barrel domain-containing protein n=1 Tax=Algibacter lectus TaxID=221126 RepID=A0A090X477_9FLAO|nr:outer membrane beta-barrel protein [Algibacter lectus]GAL77302.1 hypothetical protein JCM19274_5015 [Algibacter lectus]